MISTDLIRLPNPSGAEQGFLAGVQLRYATATATRGPLDRTGVCCLSGATLCARTIFRHIRTETSNPANFEKLRSGCGPAPTLKHAAARDGDSGLHKGQNASQESGQGQPRLSR